jgi:NADH dehydrogenase FAD-containing subunit
MVARALDRRFFVVLIDRKDFFSHQVALPRAVVEPSMANKSFMPYTRMLTNGVAITATVTSITPTEVLLSGLSTPITFDYLIIALGSSYTLPSRIGPSVRSSALTQYTTVRAAVERANSVLVIGAGAVGTELAAEVATDFPGKKVTLVNAHSYFGVAGLTDKVRSHPQSPRARPARPHLEPLLTQSPPTVPPCWCACLWRSGMRRSVLSWTGCTWTS